mmetsp:Transcript_34029/g.104484  ORF Transcript_34029/g.104484 Transcript_34029/m.104484 type:complete len:240 (-) Transcript_34029:2512-3231(-)
MTQQPADGGYPVAYLARSVEIRASSSMKPPCGAHNASPQNNTPRNAEFDSVTSPAPCEPSVRLKSEMTVDGTNKSPRTAMGARTTAVLGPCAAKDARYEKAAHCATNNNGYNHVPACNQRSMPSLSSVSSGPWVVTVNDASSSTWWPASSNTSSTVGSPLASTTSSSALRKNASFCTPSSSSTSSRSQLSSAFISSLTGSSMYGSRRSTGTSGPYWRARSSNAQPGVSAMAFSMVQLRS